MAALLMRFLLCFVAVLWPTLHLPVCHVLPQLTLRALLFVCISYVPFTLHVRVATILASDAHATSATDPCTGTV